MPEGLQTILVVEDEQSLRELSCAFLRGAGYRLLQANSGDEALEIAARHDGPIHLLMTDTVMPGLSAGELAKRLNAQRPEIRVLYISGYSQEIVKSHGISFDGEAFLQKPFSRAQLISKVKEVLTG
jgi:two-component system cell cycle sensor histidine kinase/response regulator CckA